MKKSNILRLLRHERKAIRAGFKHIAGIDEAGRGPLAGPVVACCLILKETRFEHRIDDSKKLAPMARFLAYQEILKKAHFGLGIVSEKVIDGINIYNATILAMEESVARLSLKPDFILVDGRIRLGVPCKKSYIIKGDSKSLTIACASIVAKVTRDGLMADYHKRYPEYGFLRHKGYATREHVQSLQKHGPSEIHRLTFSPVKETISKFLC